MSEKKVIVSVTIQRMYDFDYDPTISNEDRAEGWRVPVNYEDEISPDEFEKAVTLEDKARLMHAADLKLFGGVGGLAAEDNAFPYNEKIIETVVAEYNVAEAEKSI